MRIFFNCDKTTRNLHMLQYCVILWEHCLCVSAFDVSIEQLMLNEGSGDMLTRRIDRLSYPCQQTMKLIKLAKTMVTFQHSSRPDMNSVFRSLTGIMRQGIPLQHEMSDLCKIHCKISCFILLLYHQKDTIVCP